MTGTMREPFDMFSPVVGFQFASGTAPEHNYAKIVDLNKYYFVTDWYYSEGLWWATLHEDVLATFKTDIGISTQYVLRSSHTYDNTIIDTLYPTKCDIAGTNQDIGDFFSGDLDTGSYVLGVLNDDFTSTIGMTLYTVVSPAQFAQFKDILWTKGSGGLLDLMGITDISAGLQEAMLNVTKYIISCVWIPISYSVFTETEQNDLRYGFYSISVKNKPLIQGGNQTIRSSTIIANLSPHPLAATRGEYLSGYPYTKMKLTCPPFCYNMELPAIDITKYEKLTMQVTTEITSGDSILQIIATNSASTQGINLAELTGTIGVPIMLSQATVSNDAAKSAVAGAVSTVASIATGNIPGAISGGIGMIMNGLDLQYPNISTIGMNGNTLSVEGRNYLYYEYKIPVPENLSDRGRPLCQNKQVSSIPGFMLCSDVHPDFLLATEEEKNSVRDLMESGFFYE